MLFNLLEIYKPAVFKTKRKMSTRIEHFRPYF